MNCRDPWVKEAYLEWLISEKVTKCGIASRFKALDKFVMWSGTASVQSYPQVTEKELRQYCNYLDSLSGRSGKQALSQAYKYRLVQQLKQFFMFLEKTGRIDENYSKQIRVDCKPFKDRLLTADEIQAIVSSPDASTPLGIRDRALLELIRSTLLSDQQIVLLSLQDCTPSAGGLVVVGVPNEVSRKCTLGTSTVEWLEKYLSEARPVLVRNADPGTLFLNEWGRAPRSRWVYGIVRRHVMRQGLVVTGSSKSRVFRNSCRRHDSLDHILAAAKPRGDYQANRSSGVANSTKSASIQSAQENYPSIASICFQ